MANWLKRFVNRFSRHLINRGVEATFAAFEVNPAKRIAVFYHEVEFLARIF